METKASKVVFEPTDTQIDKAIHHVLYEFNMLLFSYLSLNKFPKKMDDNEKNQFNCLLECFLVHFRAIYFFFFIQRIKDDVVATDYQIKKFENGLSNESTQLINKNLAHLTYSRLEKPNWPYQTMTKEITPFILNFLEKIENNVLLVPDDIETLNNQKRIIKSIL
jgi:hypothetical protein